MWNLIFNDASWLIECSLKKVAALLVSKERVVHKIFKKDRHMHVQLKTLSTSIEISYQPSYVIISITTTPSIFHQATSSSIPQTPKQQRKDSCSHSNSGNTMLICIVHDPARVFLCVYREGVQLWGPCKCEWGCLNKKQKNKNDNTIH